jgi:hypothetical protein
MALGEMDRGKGYRAASKLADSLREIWSANGEVEPWEIVGRIFEESWLKTRHEREGIVNDTDWREAINPEE